MKTKILQVIVAAVLLVCLEQLVRAEDWPTPGRAPTRNMAAPDSVKGLPATFTAGEPTDDGYDMAKAKGIKWVAALGLQSYGGAVVGGGKVLVGTNNERPRDLSIPKDVDRAILLCLDEASGKLLWQLAIPKLQAGKEVDYPNTGICSTATIDGNRGYVVTNRGEVICFDMVGLANGNDGPFLDEETYFGEPGKPRKLSALDGDIIWKFDLRDELGVFPHQASSSSLMVYGDKVYAGTSNGVDWSPKHIPAPNSPALVCLDKNTGKLLGVEKSGISGRTFCANWCSPSLAMVNGKAQVIFGADDGFLYGFDPEPKDGALSEIWRCDVNRPDVRKGKFGTSKGPSGVLAMPVFAEGKVYALTGQDPEQGDGQGGLVCIDPTGSGDVTETKKVWTFPTIGRSLSAVAVRDGLVYASDFGGTLYCVDAASGKQVWKHDCEAQIWCSPLLADGKIYIGNESGELSILAEGRTKKHLGTIKLDSAIKGAPLAVNGVLYLTTEKYLYSIDGK